MRRKAVIFLAAMVLALVFTGSALAERFNVSYANVNDWNLYAIARGIDWPRDLFLQTAQQLRGQGGTVDLSIKSKKMDIKFSKDLRLPVLPAQITTEGGLDLGTLFATYAVVFLYVVERADGTTSKAWMSSSMDLNFWIGWEGAWDFFSGLYVDRLFPDSKGTIKKAKIKLKGTLNTVENTAGRPAMRFIGCLIYGFRNEDQEVTLVMASPFATAAPYLPAP